MRHVFRRCHDLCLEYPTDRRFKELKRLLRKKCDHLGVLTFGAEFDALRCLPQLQIERQTPGVLNKVKRNGNLSCL